MRRFILCALLVLAASPARYARAGTTNPDISVIGQPLIRWTDEPGNPEQHHPVFSVGETEFVFDAALNPYARGFFTVSLAEGEVGLEEGYFSLLRGLPGGITLKGGKYRVGFGKLNEKHPHTYPFAERFGVLAAYLPGAESFNETGMDVSYRLPLPIAWSVTASADVLQGDSFRRPRAASQSPDDPLNSNPENGDAQQEPRMAWVGRLAAFAPAGDRGGVELGVSATEGTNNVAADARTRVVGGDVKAKLWTSPNAYLLVQGEWLSLDRDEAGWGGLPAGYTLASTKTSGGYAYADYNWASRYNAGGSYEHYEDPDAPDDTVDSFGLYAGLALMEETTAFRLDWRRSQRQSSTVASDPVQELTLRVIFSMGPHKAHQF
jgi:hypothetical protein